MGNFAAEHLATMKEGILLFNAGKYWECHEELEDHWLEARGDNIRYIYWAVILAGNALYHYQDDKILGARGQISRAKDKVKKCRELNIESELLFKSLNWKNFGEVVLAIPAKPELEDFNALSEFVFTCPKNWEK
ncbi:MAG: DUF309 domain-containing protein [Halobacteriovoraceae bacterium]|nr:DUF309 domain-containing protein [Halobacteriovoraceae bacterium]MBT5093036.1 DUF309 domain-containing protein [Halobacteriovoraceae bacterium]